MITCTVQFREQGSVRLRPNSALGGTGGKATTNCALGGFFFLSLSSIPLENPILECFTASFYYQTMSHAGDTDFDQLTRSLTENFNLLADDVQLLSDRKTVLEHKLRFAHEQVSSNLHFLYTPLIMMRHLSSRSGAPKKGNDSQNYIIN